MRKFSFGRFRVRSQLAFFCQVGDRFTFIYKCKELLYYMGTNNNNNEKNKILNNMQDNISNEISQKDLRFYAKVHSIESFGTVDGPGIRFVLFLQGCHLQCKYCHNRDTWDMNNGEYKSLDDIFEKIMKYKNYIYPNGGVTVTGGEPLLQVKFLIELFTKLKEQKIHTCIDTSRHGLNY